jgi:hypothetical protein
LSPGKNKVIDLKPTGFEMIPEEDEERLRTDNESSRRFFDSKPRDILNNMRNFDSLKKKINKNSGEIEENHIIRLKHTLDKDIMSTNKNLRSISNGKIESNNIYKNFSACMIKGSTGFKEMLNRGPSRERSVESFSTNEYTYDSAKNKKILNVFNYTNVNDKEHLGSNFNTSNSRNILTTSIPNKCRSHHFEDFDDIFTLVKNNAINNQDDFEIIENKIFSQKRSPSKKIRKLNMELQSNNDGSQKETLSNEYDVLPIIKTNKNSDLNSIFKEIDDFKEDPVIKRKLDDIMQNILDIRNVLSSKSNMRLKIASAPTNMEELGCKQAIGHEFLLGANKLGNLPQRDVKSRENIKSTFSGKIENPILAISSTLSNINKQDKKVSLNSNTKFNSCNLSIFQKKEKVPIKLIKKE